MEENLSNKKRNVRYDEPRKRKRVDKISRIREDQVDATRLDIFKSGYVLTFFAPLSKFLGDHLIRSIDQKINFNEFGTEYEIYLKTIWEDFMRINDSLENLNITPRFLKTDPFPEELLVVDINEFIYFKYHYEHFHIRIISIIDFCAYLINSTYRLGIPNRKCSVQTILENKRSGKTTAATLLREFNQEFLNFRKLRNTIVHEGKFDAERIESIDTSILNQDLVPIQQPIKKWFEERKKKAKEEVCMEVSNSITKCKQYIREILDALEPELKMNMEFLLE